KSTHQAYPANHRSRLATDHCPGLPPLWPLHLGRGQESESLLGVYIVHGEAQAGEARHGERRLRVEVAADILDGESDGHDVEHGDRETDVARPTALGDPARVGPDPFG